ncbi:MAG TPA: hypothetical protein VN903_19660 [Polyangia bacterium]|jgi:hypothetical protein|nr:hypothetical protein [Polyangia bacterium]
MRFPCAALASITLVAGCAERLPWPLAADDVARINEAAHEENGYLRVEYVDPLEHKRDTPATKPIAIDSVTVDSIGFRTRAGETRVVPIERVEGVTVKDRNRGGFAGGLVGLGAAGLELAGLWFLSDGRGDCLSCSGVAQAVLIVAGINVFLGVVIGYAISGRRTLVFDRAR